MDRIDQKILNELRRDGRISNADLAERVSLSPSPCARRVRNLEKAGIIEGYTANINLEKYGLPINAFVSVELNQPDEDTMKQFERGVQRFDEVMECYLVSGKQDYLLRVVSPSLSAYEQFIRKELTQIPEIRSIESIFAFGQVKKRSELPSGV